jgi:hypothetical protein
MPVSRDTLLRVIRALPLPTVEPPRVVGMDDWALRKGRTYGTILVDLERRRVLDLLADRSANTVAGWLRDHPGIVVVARDRSAEYARAATNGAGQATQVADRWHLLANTRQMLERWLLAVHGRLRRLPPVHTDASAIAPRRTRAFPRPRAERVASVASHERWLAVYKEVRRRHAAGETLLGIARSMGLARGTDRKYVQAQSFPERALRAPGSSALDPFIPHLTVRVAAGCENGMELWREVRALGYAGRPKAVHLWLQQHRSVPAKTTPHRWRKETPTPSGGPPALLSPKRLAWALVKPAEPRKATMPPPGWRLGSPKRVPAVSRQFRRLLPVWSRMALQFGRHSHYHGAAGRLRGRSTASSCSSVRCTAEPAWICSGDEPSWPRDPRKVRKNHRTGARSRSAHRTIDTVRRDLKEEVLFVEVFDRAMQGAMDRIDMPNRKAAQLVRLMMRNNRIGKEKRLTLFPKLSDAEIDDLERIVHAAGAPPSDEDDS